MEAEGSSTEDWFRYDRLIPVDSGTIYEQICQDVISKLEIAETYWRDEQTNRYFICPGDGASISVGSCRPNHHDYCRAMHYLQTKNN